MAQIDWETIAKCLEETDNTKLDEELQSLKIQGNLLTQIVDQQGYTLIIHAVLQGKPGKVGYLILKTIELDNASLETIQQWVKVRDTEEGFTALHYAAYKSNLDACATLLRYGAEKDAISTYGLSVLHVASQTNSAAPLYFFKELGVDLNLKDKSGTTALQWAIFSSAEISAAYLLAWNPKLDEQNEQGQTALHTAVKQVNDSEAVRCIRFLLLRGAKKDIRDNFGKLPVDYCDTIENARLLNEAAILLGKPSRCDFLMLKPATRKMRKSPKTMIVFLCLFLLCMLIQVFMTFPHLPTVQIFINLACMIICSLFLFLASLKQPGFLKPQTTEFMRLLATVDSTSLCADCSTIRTSRSRHCSICGHCVERFDHHCPWINNCVGVGNHMHFYFFIVFMFLTLLASFLQGFTVLVESFNTDSMNNFSHYGKKLGYEPRKSVFVLFVIILILITFCFLMPVGFLVYIQTINLAGGKTTNERMSRQVGGSHEDQQIRALNSGIKNDKRIIYDTNFNPGSFSSGMKNKHGLNELLFDEEITTRQPSDTLPYIKKKQIREQHISKGCCGKTMDNCSIMCCGSKQVGQDHIFQRYTTSKSFQCENSKEVADELCKIIKEYKENGKITLFEL